MPTTEPPYLNSQRTRSETSNSPAFSNTRSAANSRRGTRNFRRGITNVQILPKLLRQFRRQLPYGRRLHFGYDLYRIGIILRPLLQNIFFNT